jgi:hypothetical protein
MMVYGPSPSLQIADVAGLWIMVSVSEARSTQEREIESNFYASSTT